MAEILVRLSEPDAGSDPRHTYHRGDIFAIRPDGFAWGKCEVEPHFQVVKLPGERVGYELRTMVGAWTNADGEQYRASLWRWNFEAGCLERKSDKLRRKF